MPQLVWSPAAVRDLERLRRFLLPKDPEAARRAIRTIRERVGILRSYPRLGQPVARLGEQYREWSVPFGNSGYIVRYRDEGDELVILMVRHFREARS